MRFLLKVNIPNDAGNAAARLVCSARPSRRSSTNRSPRRFTSATTADSGVGTCLSRWPTPAEIPAFAEPWFQAFNAQIELHPVMTPADLGKAAAGIEQAVGRFGK